MLLIVAFFGECCSLCGDNEIYCATVSKRMQVLFFGIMHFVFLF
ncbi:hypothetical protein FTV88_3057 [Heliorestis convoluta]|uniref:Uncharacterized protein n=1 Tax=Heliorestis convoluta TaxID=356322 RepID=A0A5Q2N6W6_9FIRM|nr:hypothetical protein FTV88_3057 [Heliorestis convoluta]